MDFSEAISSKMRDVDDGSTEPFIIYRDNSSGWHSDYTQKGAPKTNKHGEMEV